MNNIKSLLKEELLLNDKKNSLSVQSLALINDPNHVKHILGIDVPLNEYVSLETRQQIIEAQLGLDKMLTSITNYVGNAVEKGKEKTISVIDSIKTLKDFALMVKDLLISPNLMETAMASIKNVAKKMIDGLYTTINTINNKLNNVADNFVDKLKLLIDHVVSELKILTSQTGWVGFLKILGFCTLIKFLNDSIFLKIDIDMIKKFANLFDGVSSILNTFKDFSNTIINSFDIQTIINWFNNIGVNNVLKPLFAGISVMKIISEILTPVIKSVDWGKKLTKK